jgi:hypothetical protein
MIIVGHLSTAYIRQQLTIYEGEMGVTCSMHGRDEKCLQYFDWKT